MERFTISLSDELAQQFDELLKKKGYQNRSEAVRDMVRTELAAASIERHEAPFCVAALSYVYNHHARDLAERLTELQHAHHDIVLSSMHVHLDHDNCMETLILRGATDQVSKFAHTLMAEPEVRHGRLNLVPVDIDKGQPHGHGQEHGHGLVGQYHVHSKPRT
ncbi:MAG TPA: nickel-responsive transcriptional regulator NikR [Burkholderiales bacterium]|jgi:CopG family nickel-responsive transcriptional regulator|nr:nickel-responsive transcriptional regulator NikR [Burkholderiales bacterium]